MENQDNSQQLFNLRLSDGVKQSLKAAAVTAGIAAILSLVKVILSLVSAFMQMGKPNPYQLEGFEQQSSTNAMRAGGIAGAVIMLVINIFLFYFLNKFSKSTKTGIDTNNQQQTSEGLGSLATYFKILGVLIIIGLAIGLLFGLALTARGTR